MTAQAPAPAPLPMSSPPLRNPPVADPGSSRRLSSEELFGTEQEVEIKHGEVVYRLRRTSLGKLILTK